VFGIQNSIPSASGETWGTGTFWPVDAAQRRKNATACTITCRSDPNCGMLSFHPYGECSGPIPSARSFYLRTGLVDQKLSATAAAMERVVSLQKNYRQRIAEAEAPAEKERIVAEANNELTKAVTEQGLSVEEYTSILDAARDNPEIRDKLLQHIRPSDK
jgi:hypothetical protein